MRISTILIFISLLFTTTVKAGVFTTVPFNQTTWVAGTTEKITWKDDGVNPPLKDLKKLQVDLFSGNDTVQVFVRNISTNVVGSKKTFSYTVPKDVGPPGQYFLKYTQDTYVQTSGIFRIEGGTTPVTTVPPSPAINNGTSPNPYASPATSTGTSAATSTGTNPASTGSPKATPTPLSSGSIVHINNLTLGGLMVLSTLLLKYL